MDIHTYILWIHTYIINDQLNRSKDNKLHSQVQSVSTTWHSDSPVTYFKILSKLGKFSDLSFLNIPRILPFYLQSRFLLNVHTCHFPGRFYWLVTSLPSPQEIVSNIQSKGEKKIEQRRQRRCTVAIFWLMKLLLIHLKTIINHKQWSFQNQLKWRTRTIVNSKQRCWN